jgi:hypothetical protein
MMHVIQHPGERPYIETVAQKRKEQNMKMYVWNKNVLVEDYTSGMAVGVAETEDDARVAILITGTNYYEEISLSDDIAGPADEVYDLPAGVFICGRS